MTRQDIINLLPGILLVSASLIAMISIAIKRSHRLTYTVSALSLAGVFYYLVTYASGRTFSIEPLFVVDGFSVFNITLMVISTLAVVMISYPYFEQREERKEEYYILLLLATLGSTMMVISKHFVSLFLGLEILSVSLYSMVAYLRRREKSDEAGIKYLVLAACSSAFFLFGVALVYAETGSMQFEGVASYLASVTKLPAVMTVGFALILVGVGFKLGIVPFHLWTPDVYEGAPAPVTAFIATVSKGGMVAALVRFFAIIDGHRFELLIIIFTLLSIASMFIGNLMALRQTNIKRILAYSSIAHMGYLLVAFLAGGKLGLEAVCFYLAAYFITSLGAFGCITILSDEDRDAERLEDYRGLLWTRPWTAAAFMATLLSLAGIPLTAGFVGKFYLIASGVSTNLWLLVFILVINSVIGLYYYIKIIAIMFAQPTGSQEVESLHPRLYWGNMTVLILLAIQLLWIGLFPE